MATIALKYRIGIDAVDRQHARWIELIERFRTAAEGHMTDEAGLAAAESSLRDLLDYTKRHFRSEERLLEEWNYPGLEAHRRHHAELEAQVGGLLKEVEAHRAKTTPLKLNLLITVWLFEHIDKEDREFAHYLRSAGYQEPGQTQHQPTAADRTRHTAAF